TRKSEYFLWLYRKYTTNIAKNVQFCLTPDSGYASINIGVKNNIKIPYAYLGPGGRTTRGFLPKELSYETHKNFDHHIGSGFSFGYQRVQPQQINPAA
ncbi:MAG: hypothetical protein GWN00_05030, partial [Aliifodinibius sp.]|nr:hypothetical protein [candidate division Zixibacteria bacterium]NIT55608.1 hypothetical protein [Fodinibius sp.]NIW43844.1 hypothetical protein [Gammaproteobacteria bacterium]NIR62959.1 hypothetical protein [candidate division Zixibacteria bacterium]NIS44980.1 hypothetical protein [candidate division Zixibacteria bacterium]